MLDEEEFAFVNQPRQDATTGPIKDRLALVCARYEQITGMPETNHIAIHHHRISLYGPPCKVCGKPLRTPEAAFCAACGQAVG
jgi:hypothetical protein